MGFGIWKGTRRGRWVQTGRVCGMVAPARRAARSRGAVRGALRGLRPKQWRDATPPPGRSPAPAAARGRALTCDALVPPHHPQRGKARGRGLHDRADAEQGAAVPQAQLGALPCGARRVGAPWLSMRRVPTHNAVTGKSSAGPPTMQTQPASVHSRCPARHAPETCFAIGSVAKAPSPCSALKPQRRSVTSPADCVGQSGLGGGGRSSLQPCGWGPANSWPSAAAAAAPAAASSSVSQQTQRRKCGQMTGQAHPWAGLDVGEAQGLLHPEGLEAEAKRAWAGDGAGGGEGRWG